jgi:uncharacterized damage-inducible protein DinB
VNEAWNTTTDRDRYPIGRYAPPSSIDEEQRRAWIQQIERLPAGVRDAVADLNETQLEVPYRANGWTIRQVVHHLPDSHMNSYTRFRLALTEDNPAIKAYEEAAWAELADARSAPIELSLSLLESLHRRWVILLRSMGAADFARTFQHPEAGRTTLDHSLGLYAWHGRHHLAQIMGVRQRHGW